MFPKLCALWGARQLIPRRNKSANLALYFHRSINNRRCLITCVEYMKIIKMCIVQASPSKHYHSVAHSSASVKWTRLWLSSCGLGWNPLHSFWEWVVNCYSASRLPKVNGYWQKTPSTSSLQPATLLGYWSNSLIKWQTTLISQSVILYNSELCDKPVFRNSNTLNK